MDTEYLVLSEATLPRLLWRAWTRRPTCVVGVVSMLQNTRGFLIKTADRLRRQGRATNLIKDFPSLTLYDTHLNLYRVTDVFREAEPWMDETFGFDRDRSRFGDYALPYRHIVCNRIVDRYLVAYRVKDLCDASRDALAQPVVSGLDRMTKRFYGQHFGSAPLCRLVDPLPIEALLKLAAAFVFLGATLAWILRRVRLRRPVPESYFLGSDFLGDFRNAILWNEVADDPGQVLLVQRFPGQVARSGSDIGKWRTCVQTDGVVPLSDLPATLGKALCGWWRVAVHGFGLPADIYRSLLAMPLKEAVYRALCNRFSFRYFWGRDDYNPEHILRTLEIRRRGGVSIGIRHGIPTATAIFPQFRYVYYDIFYVQGRDQYDRFWKERWPSDMVVRSSGTFGFSREELERFSAPRGKDIVCFLEPNIQDEAAMSAVITTARAFPDRTVFVNVKQDRKHGVYLDMFEKMLADGPSNLQEWTGRSYDLFYRCSFGLTEGTTMAAELIQVGIPTFVMDFDPRWKRPYYRDFPGLCVTEIDQAIDRIRAIEAGETEYPFHLYADMIDLSGRVIWDMIREDMGLPPRQDRPVQALAFVAPDYSPSKEEVPPYADI